MRKDITFTSQGLRCAGWLYVPDDLAPGTRAPAIVMAHGYSAVKEMHLSGFADRFAAAGFVTLVFDYRCFGESEGDPRGQLFPLEQQEDYRNAITWVSALSEVDEDRIGVWGTSFSGGLVLYLATFDRRVKAVVAQVPGVGNWETRRNVDPERFDRTGDLLISDRVARYETGAVGYIPVVAPEGGSCVLSTRDSYEWFTRASEIAPSWRNRVTLESLERQREFDPVSLIHLIAPTPLLLIAAERDSLIPLETVVAAHERACEPKALSVLPCDHFDVYCEPWLSRSAGLAVDWFTRYLGGADQPPG